MKFAKAVVRSRVIIMIVSLILLVPAFFGMVKTRINYDMLTYLPKDIETVKGQDILMDEFGKGAFSFIVVEGMDDRDVSKLADRIREVGHVDMVLWYDSFMSANIPKEMLPDKVLDLFNSGDATMLAVFFDSSTSSDVTMQAIRDIRSITGKECFVSGMSALVTDLKALCEKEEPVYVAIAVVLATAAMMIFLDGYIVPFVFLASIGMAILYNLGTNYFLGEISYITKALSAVLQLAVTMDYSIFLWNSYNEKRIGCDDNRLAMEKAIKETLTSVVGSSVTTIAGFIALCFMSFTLGRDLGIVMAKGVLFGVIGCVTILPSMILLLDKPLQKTRHKSIIPSMEKPAAGIVGRFVIYLVIFALLIAPAYIGYRETNKEVYYDLGKCLPDNIDVAVADKKLSETFGVASTHMLLVDTDTDDADVRTMLKEIEKVKGVKNVLAEETLVGPLVPESILPASVIEKLKSENHELVLINSEYAVASDAVNAQISEINRIVKKYDKGGMLIGEAPCMKDMIETTDKDFKVVNTVSIAAIFVIILLVEKSVSLPFILISVIELAIFINLGLPHYMGESLPFIAPICISTIQLGATVDYAILMTTRYKSERMSGLGAKDAVKNALSASIPSIIVSGAGLFAATFGVAVYSNIDIISSMCLLMARGAVISVLLVIFILPSLLRLCDGAIVATTYRMKRKEVSDHEENSTKNSFRFA